MADAWQCDTCCICFPSTKNRIQLERKIQDGENKYEYIPYQDICTDCELYHKKWLKEHRRNNVKSVKEDEA